MEYLGFIISQEGVSTNLAKIEAIQNWPSPRNVREVHIFLGLTGWYKIFNPSYAQIASPITITLKKAKEFVWTPSVEDAFQILKEILSRAPILALPKFSKPFMVTTNASGQAIGRVLSQEGKPIAFESRKLRDHKLITIPPMILNY